MASEKRWERFATGSRPVTLDASTLSLFCDPAVQIGKPLVKQRVEVPLDGTMRIELNKQIVSDHRRYFKPLPHTVGRRHIVAGDLAGFETRHEPSAKTHPHRAGNHQHVALAATAYG